MSDSANGWRRLHPLTIFKELGSLAWAFAGALVLDLDFIPISDQAARTEVVAAVAVFAYALVRYFSTAYQVTGRTLELRRGVLVRSVQSMPRDRVQSVGVTTGLAGRFLGISSIEVSAADSEDIKLSYVTQGEAGRLARVLEPDRRESDSDDPEERLDVASLDLGRLLTFGLTEFGFLAAAILVLVSVPVAIVVGFPFAPLPAVAIAVWPVIRTVSLADFRSWMVGDRIRIEAGLISRHVTESPMGRIQAVQVVRPPFRRMIGSETVSIVTGDVSVSQDNVVAGGIVAPLEPIGTWRRLAELLIGHVEIGETRLRPSSPHTIRRTITRSGLVLLAVCLVAGAALWRLERSLWIPATVLLVGMGVVIAYARFRWRVLGWAADETHLVIRRGVVTRVVTIVPIGKVQDVTVRATPFQRRLGLATVAVDTAGVTLSGAVEAVDLELGTARQLADHLAAHAAHIALPDGV